MDTENKISKTKNSLLILSKNKGKQSEDLRYLSANFCGKLIENLSEIPTPLCNKKIYLCGDISMLNEKESLFFVIEELSYNFENKNNKNIQIVKLGQVPVIISNAGVYFRRLFEEDNYFENIEKVHEFQQLTESNKEGHALRKGIYLTKVSKEKATDASEILHYRLLRCSSNLTGPTDNLREIDLKVVNAINDAAESVFETKAYLNHVLAQIYENKKTTGLKVKETKAKIKAHSDKTKDMPKEGLIAFCTFYDKSNLQHLKPSKSDKYDLCYKKTSGLTRLHFKLKNSVQDTSLDKTFSVVLYPNSVFIIPLSTNRLYTHEIRPSMLNIDKIPIRMGYVVRCSKAEAVFKDNQVYIKENDSLVRLAEMTTETMTDLRTSYYEENITKNIVKYGKVHFSMNSGDYQKPIY